MPAPDTLTISAAARLCRVDRRTLQRAIHAGRLHLDAEHCLDREELLSAGYLRMETPQGTPQSAPQGTPQRAPQETPQPPPLFLLLGRLTIAVEGLWAEVRQLRAELRQPPHGTPQYTPRGRPQPAPRGTPQQTPRGTPQQTPQGTPQQTPQGTPQPDDCPPFDATKNRLGRLCPRRHEWGRTGQSLLRLPSMTCRQCENERQRERRAAQRQAPP